MMPARNWLASCSIGIATEQVMVTCRDALSAYQRRSLMKCGSTSKSSVRRVQPDNIESQPGPITSVVISCGKALSGS